MVNAIQNPYYQYAQPPQAMRQMQQMHQMQQMQNEYPPVSAKPDYTAYVDYLEVRGWAREQLTLDEFNTQLVTLTDVPANTTGVAIDTRCPAGQKISIMGVQQIPRGADARSAHSLRIRFADSDDNEIPLNTKLRLTKEKTSEAVVQLARIFYADANLTKNIGVLDDVRFKTDPEWYRQKQGVELNGEQRFRIRTVNSTSVVDDGTTRFAQELDLWTKEE